MDLVPLHLDPRQLADFWFTEQERAWTELLPYGAWLAWGAKEAVYKATCEQESFAPRDIEIMSNANGVLARRRDVQLEGTVTLHHRVYENHLAVVALYNRIHLGC